MYPQNVKRIIEKMAEETHKRVSAKTMKRYIKKRARLETDEEDDPEIA
jgi:hypothetical protein